MMLSLLVSMLFSFQAPKALSVDLLEKTDKPFEYGGIVLVTNPQPSFSWEIAGRRANTLQTSCRVLVASSRRFLKEGKADVWDSGVIETDNSSALPMTDAVLEPSTRYWWTVRYTDNYGNASRYARPKSFTTAVVLDGSQPRYPVQKYEQKALSIQVKDSVCVADFGRAAYSQPVLRISAAADAKVTVWLGEKLLDGAVDRKPGGTIRVSHYDLMVQKGTRDYPIDIVPDQRNSTIVPGRSFNPVPVAGHLGGDIYPFRYVEVDGVCPEVRLKAVTRYAVNYPFNEEASSFSCSDETLNAVWDLCRYTMKASSALGVYIDGDRERIPYEADALINQLSHYSVDREYAMARYTVEYLSRNATWPTEWILQAVLMAWNDYVYTGNDALLRRNYDILKARTLSALRNEDGLVSTRTGLQTPELMASIGYAGASVRDIVDWPQGGAAGVGKAEAGEADGYVFTDYNAVVNAFHYRSLVLMEKIAGVLGREEDAASFAVMAGETYDSFNRLFWDGAGYRDGDATDHHSLHANMMPLAFGLVPEGRREPVLALIRKKGMACSVYGAQFLLDALYEAGDDEYALSLLTSKGERGWYHMIELGSTMTLEAWDAKFKPNLDWNHAWGAAPANVIPRELFGIQPLEPAFRRFSVRPQLGGLEWAEITVPTVRGRIVCRCRKAGAGISVDLEVPQNTEAELLLPDGSLKVLGSGKHHIE